MMRISFQKQKQGLSYNQDGLQGTWQHFAKHHIPVQENSAERESLFFTFIHTLLRPLSLLTEKVDVAHSLFPVTVVFKVWVILHQSSVSQRGMGADRIMNTGTFGALHCDGVSVRLDQVPD